MIIFEYINKIYNYLTHGIDLSPIFAPLLFIYIIIMKNGTVKFFNESKGFGFITDSETKEDFFVHISGVNEEIREGDEVQYELREGRKGMNAVNVTVL